jgi:RNA polymerase sigma factor (sigma-70 family)
MSTIGSTFPKKIDWSPPPETLSSGNNRALSSGALAVASGPLTTTSFYLSALFRWGTSAGLSDGELVEQFVSKRADQSEIAFASLVARHGPMVLRVCRAELGNRHEAEDAFQATFLVLATRARSIRRGASVGSWLHGVALRVAARARSCKARRHRHERRQAERTTIQTQSEPLSPLVNDDSDRVLHEEIGRLSERFRSAVVPCYLEGLTHEMAADQLGCPVGTIRSRLATARGRLRQRLAKRGVALDIVPAPFAAKTLVTVAESNSVPVALVDATVRGAMSVGRGMGTAALSGAASLEVGRLADGILKTTLVSYRTLLTAVLVAGMVAAGAVGGAFNGSERDHKFVGASAAQASVSQPVPDKAAANKKDTGLISQENVKAILADYAAHDEAYRKIAETAKTIEQAKALMLTHPAPDPAFYAGALLQVAERGPGTPAAEEALVWIVTHLMYSSIAERAKEIIARDHIESDKIEPLFNDIQISMTGSKATEQLFREASVKSPMRKIQGLACYYLARYLDYQASFVRLEQLVGPGQGRNFGSPLQKSVWGQDYQDRLRKLDAAALEREAIPLYERVVKDFADFPLDKIGSDRGLPGRPTTLGSAAQLYLRELKTCSVDQIAPEIDGVDLTGRPMKLSDFRGKVVALLFRSIPPAGGRSNRPRTLAESMRNMAMRHANDPFVLLGVATTDALGEPVMPNTNRDVLKSALETSKLPGRFWFDPDEQGKSGPIQTEWNTHSGLFVLDHRGVIRFKHVQRPELFEKAIETLLKEQQDALGKRK